MIIAKWNTEKESVRKEYIENWLKDTKKFHEKHIFNTFVTDDELTVKRIFENTFKSNINHINYKDKDLKVMSIPYYNYHHPHPLKEGEK